MIYNAQTRSDLQTVEEEIHYFLPPCSDHVELECSYSCSQTVYRNCLSWAERNHLFLSPRQHLAKQSRLLICLRVQELKPACCVPGDWPFSKKVNAPTQDLLTWDRSDGPICGADGFLVRVPSPVVGSSGGLGSGSLQLSKIDPPARLLVATMSRKKEGLCILQYNTFINRKSRGSPLYTIWSNDSFHFISGLIIIYTFKNRGIGRIASNFTLSWSCSWSWSLYWC